MISQYDVIQAFRKAKEENTPLQYKLSDDEKTVIDSKTNEELCSIKTYVQYMREKLHCDFETVYYEHVSLDNVIRCRQCGTVIFAGDDERYDPSCRCPTCCDDPSVCRNRFWTADEIEADPEKKEHVQALEDAQKAIDEAEARRKARGGLYDWQRWVKIFQTKRHHITVSYLNFGWGMPGKKHNKYIEIIDYELDNDGCFSYGVNKGHKMQIPLNLYSIYLQWIYPYSNKCRPELRKHHFWQKKPTTVK